MELSENVQRLSAKLCMQSLFEAFFLKISENIIETREDYRIYILFFSFVIRGVFAHCLE